MKQPPPQPEREEVPPVEPGGCPSAELRGHPFAADLLPAPQQRAASAAATSWRRPAGVAPGTWAYTHQGSIAEHYDAFVAQTPLCRLDEQFVTEVFPPTASTPSVVAAERTSVRGGGTAGEKKSWILDLGCGTGRTAQRLSRAGYGVVAVDLSLPMLRQVRHRRLIDVQPIRANLAELDGLGDAVADGAVCLFSTFGMIQGRRYRRAMLRHVRRILRPGGRLLLHAHHRYASLTQRGGWRLLWQSWRDSWRRGTDFGDAVYPYRGLENMFLHRFSRHEVVRDLRTTGWKLQRIERISLEGTKILPASLPARCRLAGGFFFVASVPEIADATSGSQ